MRAVFYRAVPPLSLAHCLVLPSPLHVFWHVQESKVFFFCDVVEGGELNASRYVWYVPLCAVELQYVFDQ